MQSLSRPESPNWRNQIVGHWFSFCVWPWTASPNSGWNGTLVGLPRLGFLSLFPLSCPGGTRQQPFPNMPLDPLPALIVGSGKWEISLGSYSLQTGQTSKGKVSGDLFVSLLSLVGRQSNRKQTLLTHKYLKYATDQSSNPSLQAVVWSAHANKDRYSPSVGSRTGSAPWGEMVDFLNIWPL